MNKKAFFFIILALIVLNFLAASTKPVGVQSQGSAISLADLSEETLRLKATQVALKQGTSQPSNKSQLYGIMTIGVLLISLRFVFARLRSMEIKEFQITDLLKSKKLSQEQNDFTQTEKTQIKCPYCSGWLERVGYKNKKYYYCRGCNRYQAVETAYGIIPIEGLKKQRHAKRPSVPGKRTLRDIDLLVKRL